MNVHELGGGLPAWPGGPHFKTQAAAESRPDATQRAAPGDDQAVQRRPDAEVIRWVRALKELPEVRPEAVARAEARLSEGVYLTPAAAEETASALLGEP